MMPTISHYVNWNSCSVLFLGRAQPCAPISVFFCHSACPWLLAYAMPCLREVIFLFLVMVKKFTPNTALLLHATPNVNFLVFIMCTVVVNKYLPGGSRRLTLSFWGVGWWGTMQSHILSLSCGCEKSVIILNS